MLGRVFRYQGWLWRALNTLTDILALSVLWLLCSIPVLTLGAATTALYDSVVRCIRYKQSGPYERFFRTFKNELVPGLLLTLLWGAIAALGVVQKVFMFAFSISLGIGQGFQPVLGYNYSARRFDRVRGAYLFTLVFSTALMSVFAVVCAIAAPAIMRQFLSSEKAI